MANVQFNKTGIPLIGYGSRGLYLSTMGGPEVKPKNIAVPQKADPDKTYMENYAVSDWGSGNNFPIFADKKKVYSSFLKN